MSVTVKSSAGSIYPDSDGQPMADNTLQFEWISVLKWELEALFANDTDVFVAGDLLWYPVEGRPDIRNAPDVFVAFGRPKGYRGSYRQWEEDGIAPQVIFEILSPGNRLGEVKRKRGEMRRKLEFYERYGVEEYYVYNPDNFALTGWQCPEGDDRFRAIHSLDGWVSPLLGVRFDASGDREMIVYRPDGVPFRSPVENRRTLEQTQSNLEQSQSETERMKAKLRELGIDPDKV